VVVADVVTRWASRGQDVEGRYVHLDVTSEADWARWSTRSRHRHPGQQRGSCGRPTARHRPRTFARCSTPTGERVLGIRAVVPSMRCGRWIDRQPVVAQGFEGREGMAATRIEVRRSWAHPHGGIELGRSASGSTPSCRPDPHPMTAREVGRPRTTTRPTAATPWAGWVSPRRSRRLRVPGLGRLVVLHRERLRGRSARPGSQARVTAAIVLARGSGGGGDRRWARHRTGIERRPRRAGARSSWRADPSTSVRSGPPRSCAPGAGDRRRRRCRAATTVPAHRRAVGAYRRVDILVTTRGAEAHVTEKSPRPSRRHHRRRPQRTHLPQHARAPPPRRRWLRLDHQRLGLGAFQPMAGIGAYCAVKAAMATGPRPWQGVDARGVRSTRSSRPRRHRHDPSRNRSTARRSWRRWMSRRWSGGCPTRRSRRARCSWPVTPRVHDAGVFVDGGALA